MNKIWTLAFFALLLSGTVQAQYVSVYKQVAHGGITASASSELEGFAASGAVDGEGMEGNRHKSHNLGNTMWISEVSTSVVRANVNTKLGAVWFMCMLPAVEKQVDCIQIWNHNQNQHTGRGLNKVYVEYSVDGKLWTLLRDGANEYHVVPEAVGRKQEPVSLSIETSGIALRYLCITADRELGNHYHAGGAARIEQAVADNQNVNYYGISEVRMLRRERVNIAKLERVDSLRVIPSQGYIKTPEGPAREFHVEFSAPVYGGGKLSIEVCGKRKTMDVAPSADGVLTMTCTFPAGYMNEATTAQVTFTPPHAKHHTTAFLTVPAARKWKLYFLPHSHLDIGYTHRQKDVMELQLRNLELAADLALRTKDYPEGSQYKWNAEATWTVDGYLDRYANTEKGQKLIAAIRRGDVGLDATLGSILTGISKQEELMHIFDDAHKIAAATGVEINTAMMSDVPGQSWGLVTAMAQNGVRYFSSGPNYVPTLGRLGSYGVGLYNLKFGDLPFWWQSQSGNEKVLYWQTGKGYSMFHGWLMDKLSVCGVDPVWGYLNELEQREYPYALTYLRYTIHGDNGPPDESMPDVIRAWNEKYESPRFVIGTTKELFSEMEELYGDYLPTYAGDMTPIWEDGAASSARELALNRESSERLNQTEILWSMTRSADSFPAAKMHEAWKYVVLFSEHTWGASASGPEPESKFTKDLWAGKKLYADSADVLSRELYDATLSAMQAKNGEAKYVKVINTNLWDRSDVVTVSGVDLTDKMLQNGAGELVPVQETDGGWMFYAAKLPALSTTSFAIVDHKRESTSQKMVNANVMYNGRVRVVIDSLKGTIKSFKVAGDDYEYVDPSQGLNDYHYSLGRQADVQPNATSVRSIRVVADGEVAATVRIESDAPGCRSLVREVTIYRNSDRVDIVNILDRQNIYDHENVRFVFPFNFFNPEVTMDLAMSEMHPEREQLVSANKNFYSIHNGLSVGDIYRGIYLSTIDAPFVELGSTTAELFRQRKAATGWLNAATVSPKVYSWVMNNRWRTNYKASQEGVATFRYSIEAFDPERHELKRFGMEQAQTLIGVASVDGAQSQSLFRIKGNCRVGLSTIRPSEDGKGYVVRLQNLSPLTANGAIEWGSLNVREVRHCDNREVCGELFDSQSFWMKPYDCITLKIILK